MVLLLSVERFLAVCFPIKTILASLKLTQSLILSSWILCIVIATFPVMSLTIQSTSLNNALCVIMLSFEQLDFWYVLVVLILNTAVWFCNVGVYSAVIFYFV